MRPGLKKKTDILNEVILRKEDNIVYVDFALVSMVNAVNKLYESEDFKDDKYYIHQRSHKFHLIRSYSRNRFSDYKTIGEERNEYLKEIDLHMQMRR